MLAWSSGRVPLVVVLQFMAPLSATGQEWDQLGYTEKFHGVATPSLLNQGVSFTEFDELNGTSFVYDAATPAVHVNATPDQSTPLLLRAYSDSNGIRLQWETPLSGSAVGYNVYREIADAWVLIDTVVDTTYLDMSPGGPGLLTWYRVTAIFSSPTGQEESQPSNPAAALSCAFFGIHVGKPPNYDVWIHRDPIGCLGRNLEETLPWSGR